MLKLEEKNKMRGAFLYGPEDLRIEEMEKPKVASDEVLVRIKACGICPSDVRVYFGIVKPEKIPMLLGHEWSGEIIEVGSEVEDFKIGDRVVVDWRVICGKCYYCRKGEFNYCLNLNTSKIKGGICDYGKAVSSNLRLIPPSLSFEEATFVEPLACCINGIRRSNIKLGDTVVIKGAGQIGLMQAQLANFLGARVIISDLIKERLQKARELGINEVLSPEDENEVSKVKELTEGRGADSVIISTSNKEAVEQAIRLVRKGGTINLFAGLYPTGELKLDFNLIHYKELVVTGSHDYTPHDFSVASKLIAQEIVKVRPLISHLFSLENTKKGIETVVNKKGLKVIIKP